MKKILIIGATSAIAQATARLYAAEQHSFYLIARNTQRMALLSDDLQTRGANHVTTKEADFTTDQDYGALIADAFNTLGSVDICLIAHGTLPNQATCQENTAQTMQAIHLNGTSTIALLTELANRMEIQQKGTIAVITSVAGDRGRQSNYVYGAAKSMVSTFVHGLRNRLYKSNVHVVDIKPGFVDTPMTADFKKGALWSKPEKMALAITKGIKKRRNTVYAPSFWLLIMTIICSIPETIFKRLKL